MKMCCKNFHNYFVGICIYDIYLQKQIQKLNKSYQDKSEAGVIPALCLSNRDIDERAGGQRKSLEPRLWEGALVGYKD